MSKVREGPRERSRDREGGRDGETGREWAPCSSRLSHAGTAGDSGLSGLGRGPPGAGPRAEQPGGLGFCPSL